jgi:hypothetical protein
MGLNNIVFNLGQGGLGRPLPGEDHISGLIFYNATLPSGFSTTNRIKQIFSTADAEALGIKADYNDETQATGSWTNTVIGTNGDTVTITVNEPFGKVVNLGTYQKTATETTTTLVAAAVAAVINAGTSVHGYKAVAAAAIVTITARKGLGIALNTGTNLVATYSAAATLAGTLIQFSGGVCSKQAIWHYHIAEYFRIQPQGVLWLAFFAVPGAYTFTEITTLQNFANGTIRQVGIYKDSAAFAFGEVTAIDTVCKSLAVGHKEIIALYAADMAGTGDVSTLGDLSALTANLCSVVIGQDGAALGASLFYAYGKSITVLGAALGAVSKAAVNEDIAWVGKFNISNGTECDVPAFANGVLYSASTVTDSYLTTLQNLRYIFLRKFVGQAGTYFNEETTAIVGTSDYCFISNNRTIQKATRVMYKSLIPALNSPILLNSDGTIADVTVEAFRSLAEVNLTQMQRDGELSSKSVAINPAQNVLSTGIIVISVSLVPTGTARNISVNIGFKVNLSGS